MGVRSLLLDTEKERIETEQDGEKFTILQIIKGPGVNNVAHNITLTDKAVAAEIAAELTFWVRR